MHLVVAIIGLSVAYTSLYLLFTDLTRFALNFFQFLMRNPGY